MEREQLVSRVKVPGQSGVTSRVKSWRQIAAERSKRNVFSLYRLPLRTAWELFTLPELILNFPDGTLPRFVGRLSTLEERRSTKALFTNRSSAIVPRLFQVYSARSFPCSPFHGRIERRVDRRRFDLTRAVCLPVKEKRAENSSDELWIYLANLIPDECRRKPKRKEATRESEAIKYSWSNCSKPSQTLPRRFKRRRRLLTEDSNGQSRSLIKKWGSVRSIEDVIFQTRLWNASLRDFPHFPYESYFSQQCW